MVPAARIVRNMNTVGEDFNLALERVCSDTISANAETTDREGAFPSKSIAALQAAGLLGALSSQESGGLGLGLDGAARVVQRVAEECGSTAMVLTMHYCGVAVLEAYGDAQVRREAAFGTHLSTLAFSEAGSRSHFWAPGSTAESRNGKVELNAQKSWVTSASNATGVRLVIASAGRRGAEYLVAGACIDERSPRPRTVRGSRVARQRFVTGVRGRGSGAVHDHAWFRRTGFRHHDGRGSAGVCNA